MLLKKPIKIGQKFGRLTIIKEIKPYIRPNNKKIRRVLCLCECKNTKKIKYDNLKNGNTKSCGCLNIEKKKQRNKNNKYGLKHGMAKTSIYHIWQGIIQRCNNKDNEAYKWYGGRGITICKEWLKFSNFKNDMYESYLIHCKEFGEKDTSIDRIENDGNYCKENCQWATQKIQANNTRNNVFITYNNKTQTLSQWANELNINRYYTKKVFKNNIFLKT